MSGVGVHSDAKDGASIPTELVEWPVIGLSADERRRARELRRDSDSEDNERFASWYGDQLLAVDLAYEASQGALADLVALIDQVAPAYSASPMVANARTILGDATTASAVGTTAEPE